MTWQKILTSNFENKSISKICKNFDYTYITIKKNIDELERMNLIHIKKIGREKIINPTRKGIKVKYNLMKLHEIMKKGNTSKRK